MALTNFAKTNLQGSLQLKDGTGTPVTMTLAFDRGDFSVGPLMPILNETVKIERRGKFKTANLGARVYPTGTFSCFVAQFTDGTADVAVDFILQQNKFSSNLSTLGANHPVYTIDLAYKMEGTDYGDSADWTFTLEDCRVQVDSFAEAQDGNVLSFSYEVLGAITGDLAASEVA